MTRCADAPLVAGETGASVAASTPPWICVRSVLADPVIPPCMVRTMSAVIGEELDELQLERDLLLAEVEALRGEVEYLLALTGKEPLSDHIARRRFVTRLEEEIARASRFESARFCVVAVSVDGVQARALQPWLKKTIRRGDLLVRASRSMFLAFLHGAGALGRLRFEQRLFAAIARYEERQQSTVSVRVGSALYPRDGRTPRELIAATQQPEAFASAVPPAEARKAPGVVRLATPSTADAQVVEEALRQRLADTQVQGELVVRSREGVGRIYVHSGCVAWAHCSSASSPGARSLTEAIVRSQGASLKDVRDAFSYCKTHGKNIAEHLIDEGVVSREHMRHILAGHIQAHLVGVMTLSSPEVLFLPQSRTYGSDLLFAADELLGDGQPHEQVAGHDGLNGRAPRHVTLAG